MVVVKRKNYQIDGIPADHTVKVELNNTGNRKQHNSKTAKLEVYHQNDDNCEQYQNY